MPFEMTPGWLPFYPTPSKPRFALPPGTVDAHCHVFGPGDAFPYAPERKYTPCDAGKEQLFALRDHLGVTRNVIVQATCHGADNSALLDALAAAGDRARGVVTLRHDVSDAELRRLHAAGVRGARFNFVRRLVDFTPKEVLLDIAQRIAPLGWHVVVYFEAVDLPDLWSFFTQLPTTVVVDHMGRPDVTLPVDGPQFALFVKLMREHPNVWSKVSCPERLSVSGPPALHGERNAYRDVVPFARKLVQAFPDRVLWGTDWPHPNLKDHMPDDGLLVDHIPHIAPTAALQQALLVDNPMRLYWLHRLELLTTAMATPHKSNYVTTCLVLAAVALVAVFGLFIYHGTWKKPPDELFICNSWPIETRIYASALLIGLLIIFYLWLERRSRPDLIEEPKFSVANHFTPAWTALAVAVLLLSAMLLSGYLAPVEKISGGFNPPQVAAWFALDNVYALVSLHPGATLVGDTGALLLWACMYALTVACTIGAIWLAARIFSECRARCYRWKSLSCSAVLGMLVAAVLAVMGLADFYSGFGGVVSSTAMCGAWQRLVGQGPQRLAQMSDALNVFAIAIPIALVVGACLLLEVLGRDKTDVAYPMDVVGDIGRASQRLDHLLYVGAAALVAGTLQVSSLYALTMAHLPTMVDVKLKRDVCRPQTGDSKELSEKLGELDQCKALADDLKHADEAAPLRQHAKSLTLGFGIGFSVLLGVIYLGTAIPLTNHAKRLIRSFYGGGEVEIQKRLIDLGIESDSLGKFGRLATTLSPLAAGLVSNFLGASP